MGKLRTAITTKGQTTVPKQIREKLGVGPHDAIYWEVIGDEVRVTGQEPSFFRWLGAFEVGRGSVAEDLKRARKTRGRKN